MAKKTAAQRSYERREYILRALSGSIDFIAANHASQHARIILENLKRARAYFSVESPRQFGGGRWNIDPDTAAAEGASTEPDAGEVLADELEIENERVDGIRNAIRVGELPAEFGERLIRDCVPLEEAQRRIFWELEDRAKREKGGG